MNRYPHNRHFRSILIIFFIILSAVFTEKLHAASSSDPSAAYFEAVKLYNQGEFAKSAQEFTRIASSGVVNGQLFYNTGNAYYKAGNIGRCLVWYERSLKYIPHDPDLKFNLDYVSGLVKDKPEEKNTALYRIVFFWRYMMTAKTVQWASVLSFLVFTITALVQMKQKSKTLRLASHIILAVSLIFISTACYNYYDSRYNRKAIILVSTAQVRSGLTDDSTELFVLHEGSKVRVEEEMRGYVKIRFSDDKIGWVKKEYLEII